MYQKICHPELAAKSVELEAKRDFMPLPGVSGAYRGTVVLIFSTRSRPAPAIVSKTNTTVPLDTKFCRIGKSDLRFFLSHLASCVF